MPEHTIEKLRIEKEQKEEELVKITAINERKHLRYEFQRRWLVKGVRLINLDI